MRGIQYGILRRLISLASAFLLIFALPAFAEKPAMSALVMGNSNYAQDQLDNPIEDSKLIAETLKRLGFTVTQANDLDRTHLFATVRNFTDSLKPGAISVVYFAGHGMQINGGNYLIPIDMVPASEKSVMLNAYPLENLMDRLAHTESAVNIVILDACRNNPFQLKSNTRGFKNFGLAKVVAPRGTLIAYSTQPGQQAEDGVGTNSLYTKTLAQEMTKPGNNIEQVLKQVAETVRKKTFDEQQPWFETSLVDEFYFSPPAGVQIVTRPQKVRLAATEPSGVRRGIGVESELNNDAKSINVKKEQATQARKELASLGIMWNFHYFLAALERNDNDVIDLFLRGGMKFEPPNSIGDTIANLIDINPNSYEQIKKLVDLNVISNSLFLQTYNQYTFSNHMKDIETRVFQEYKLRKTAYPLIGEFSPLIIAIWTKQPELASYLKSLGASTDKFCAATAGQTDECILMIDPIAEAKNIGVSL